MWNEKSERYLLSLSLSLNLAEAIAESIHKGSHESSDRSEWGERHGCVVLELVRQRAGSCRHTVNVLRGVG